MNGTIETKSYSILAYNLHDFEKLIRRLNRKAARLGVLPITVTVGERTFETEDDGITVTEHVNITVAGAAPRVDGYEFVATIEHTQDDSGGMMNVLRTVPTFEGNLPESYRTATPACDHCKVNRYRKDTFVVHSAEGVFIQVGRNCLGDFLGGRNPHQYAAIAEMWALVNEAGTREWDSMGGGRGAEAVAKDEALAFVAEAVIRHGWLSRGKAREQGRDNEATADVALDAMFPPSESRRAFEPSPEAVAMAERVLAWADEWIPAQLEKGQSSDYVWNLRVALSGSYVRIRQFGIAASVVGAYQREMGKAAEYKAKNAAKAGSTHQGTVGERKRGLSLTVESVFYSEGQWGTTSIITMMDADGNVWKTFASGYHNFEQGDEVVVDGTIKAHDVYRDIKSTVLSRCKFR